VNAPSGAQIPLSQLAEIRERSGESTVTRENGQRNLTIRIDNRDRDLTSYLEEAQKKSTRVCASTATRSAWNGRPVRESAPRGGTAFGDPGLVMA